MNSIDLKITLFELQFERNPVKNRIVGASNEGPITISLMFHVNSIRRGLDIGRTYRDVGRDWRTIAALFCVTQAF